MDGKKHFGLGLLELSLIVLTVFLVLRVTGITSWPWIWVLSPIWIPVLGIMVLVSVILVISAIRDMLEIRKRRKW